ncbi:FecR domain-containing protein [Thauera sp. Sel9]|uniref:FecR domain-containing protein n=1 Tax=Thauera sp. Sel9 TaxID=2974299 RepID=UPI0021E1A4A3|nr:FecR domain-containing protein [Thauera sp. Sel9]MCV2217159.1 FecR domain-containing protein [Thauera sp. Sel9]
MNPLPDSAGNGGKLPEAVVEQAIAWYVRLSSNPRDEGGNVEFARWHDASPDHAVAWQRMLGIGSRLQDSALRVPSPLARDALNRAGSLQGKRRALLYGLAAIGTSTAVLHVLHGQPPWSGHLDSMLADARTATGQRSRRMLDDGTQLLLNTATSIDIRQTAEERRIILHQGEILVATAPDPARPLVVDTAAGLLRPVGTRFAVRREDSGTCSVAVVEGAVDIHPAAAGRSLRLAAGLQTRFTPTHSAPPAPLDESRLAWTDGFITAEGMRLADFLADLGRYRPGRLRCAGNVADLRLTGAWPLDGPDPADPTGHILVSLEQHLPVLILRLTRYWISIEARPEA